LNLFQKYADEIVGFFSDIIQWILMNFMRDRMKYVKRQARETHPAQWHVK
jgi:hypothetical protein